MDEFQDWTRIVKREFEDREWSTCEEYFEEEAINSNNASIIDFNDLIKNLITDNETESLKTIISRFSSETSFENCESKGSVNLSQSCLEEDGSNVSKFKSFDFNNEYPIPTDPGLNAAFWILYPNLPAYDLDGINKFYDTVKLLKLTSIASMRQQLLSDKITLSFYGLDSRVIQALTEAMLFNNTVKTLDLQGNHLTADACFHLNRLLLRNTVLRSLNLKNCKIKAEGALRLEDGISSSSALRELNLSYCDLGNDGFHHIARAVSANTLLQYLDVSHNNLNEGAAPYMRSMLVSTDSLKYLNASWNNFYVKESSERVFNGLTQNTSLDVVDFSWNSFNKDSAIHVTYYISNNKNIKQLNLEANHFTDATLVGISNALLSNRSLNTLILKKNPFGSKGITDFIRNLCSPKLWNCQISLIDFGSLWASKDSALLLEQVKEIKPNLEIKIEGILQNFKIIGPDLKELYFMSANYEAKNVKKKKNQRNFGHFVLSLKNGPMSKERFKEILTEAKIPISDSLHNEIVNQFLISKKTIDLVALKQSYMSFFPDTKLPTPPAPKIEVIVEPKQDENKDNKVTKGKKKAQTKKVAKKK